MPSDSSKRFLASTAHRYHQALRDREKSEAVYEYLTAERGLTEETLGGYLVGFVDDAAEGHEAASGFISIPYLTSRCIVDIRFRRPPDSEKPYKYYTLPGHPTRVFGTWAIDQSVRTIAISEGEIDAMSATQAGIPCVGIPGVKAWKDYYPRIFAGYDEVVVFSDNDDTKGDETEGVGLKFANTVARDLSEVGVDTRVVLMPEGHDVNSFMKEEGEYELRAYAGA
ncbi:toprim domain-containing protein [Brevibacterium album]|uniref:toprim domain-containing protein n=1 Tax=Brevibacterium album TaxID=417948 RepID=UPI001FE1F671|nr:toprim domain-containing protein [Brevibacterium album]